MLLEDYDVRSVAQAYIAALKVKSILNPKFGDIKAAKLTTEQIKAFIRDRHKSVKFMHLDGWEASESQA